MGSCELNNIMFVITTTSRELSLRRSITIVVKMQKGFWMSLSVKILKDLFIILHMNLKIGSMNFLDGNPLILKGHEYGVLQGAQEILLYFIL